MAIEDRRCCRHCGRPLNASPYLMAQHREEAIMPWPWALVLLVSLIVMALLIARAM